MTKKRKYNDLPKELPRFDPEPSLKIGLELLEAAGVPFALAGRLAVWTYVPPSGQQFTKDVDFAVPYEHTERVAAVARERGYRVVELSIGGAGIRAGRVSIDFIDRHPYLEELFRDAVAAAQQQPDRVRVGDRDVPVVPKGHMIAMKLVTFERDDERDVEEMLLTLSKEDYPGLRKLVLKYLGYASVQHLDVLARGIGHPGPGMKRRYMNEEDEREESSPAKADAGDDGAGKKEGE